MGERLVGKELIGEPYFFSLKIGGKEAKVAKICVGGDIMVLTTSGKAFAVTGMNLNAEGTIEKERVFEPYEPIEDISCSGGPLLNQMITNYLFKSRRMEGKSVWYSYSNYNEDNYMGHNKVNEVGKVDS